MTQRVRAALVAAVSAGVMVAPGVAYADDVQANIIGGHPATEQYSFIVSIQTERNGDLNAQYCGGALIAAQWVETAAHCMTNSDGTAKDPAAFHVRVGSLDRTTGGETADVAEIHVHPEWDWLADGGRAADIALLRLATPVTRQPIEIVAYPGIKEETPIRGLGWGRMANDTTVYPTQLQELDTQTLSSNFCEGGDFGITEGDICADNPDGTKAMCGGDSGSPVLRNISGRWQLMGTVSRGVGDTCGPSPDVHTNVPYYRSWIDGVLG